MRLTQGAFSFLPDLTDEQIVKQIQYAISKVGHLTLSTQMIRTLVTLTGIFGVFLYSVLRIQQLLCLKINSCRKAKPSFYVKVNAFDNSRGVESCCLSFIVQRPTSNEPGFQLARQEEKSRTIRYTIQSYASTRPEGERY